MHIPGDLICDIFRLVDGASDVDQKFRLSQVCTYWREVVLDAPLLWSSLKLANLLDANRLPILLNNSIRLNKRAVNLLTGLLRVSEHACGDCISTTETLLPYSTAREGVHVRLEELVIIRSSQLAYTNCEKWHGLLVPSLEHFTLDYNPAEGVPALLHEVFAHCQRLQTVSYRKAMGLSMYCDVPAQAIPGPVLPSTRFRTLRLDIAVSPQLLRAAVGLRVLDEVEIVISGRLRDQVTQELVSDIFRGLDAVVELQFDKIDYCQSFSVRDRARRLRRVSAAFRSIDEDWSLPELWLKLVQRLDIILTLKTVRANIILWENLATAFAERPPKGEIELHINSTPGIRSNTHTLTAGDLQLSQRLS